MVLTQILKIIVITLICSVPAIIWFLQISRAHRRSKTYMITTFFVSCFATLLMITCFYLWITYVQADFTKLLPDPTLPISHRQYLTYLLFFGAIEEIAKWAIILILDKYNSYVLSINDAIRMAIASALGFAFIENIAYVYAFAVNIEDFYSLILLRTVFSTTGHIIFSSIAGYYYGIAKFSKALSLHAYYKGRVSQLANFLRISQEKFYKLSSIFLGIFYASILHAIFNHFLHALSLKSVLFIIFFGVLLIMHLLHNREGKLLLKIQVNSKSTMAKKDEKVVLELMGMWMNQKKYQEVIEISDRLLMRDPANPVIHIFAAEAYNRIAFSQLWQSLRSIFSDKKFTPRQSIFKKYKKRITTK